MSDDQIAALSRQTSDFQTAVVEQIGGLRGELTKTRVEMMERIDLPHSERSERVARRVAEDARGMSEELALMRRQIYRLQAEVRALQGDP